MVEEFQVLAKDFPLDYKLCVTITLVPGSGVWSIPHSFGGQHQPSRSQSIRKVVIGAKLLLIDDHHDSRGVRVTVCCSKHLVRRKEAA